jgi:hypothetical protein
MRKDRVVQQLDRMIASGQITESEADRLRTTQGTPEFDAALGEVRARHASARLDAAVSEGTMTPEEASDYLRRLRQGEHPKGLRARLLTHKRPRP